MAIFNKGHSLRENYEHFIKGFNQLKKFKVVNDTNEREVIEEFNSLI